MGVWKLDPSHTQVEFAVKHLGIMTVRGYFADVQASGDINVQHPEDSSVEVVIQTASVRTNNDRRDEHLRTSDILDVENHPTMAFKSTKVEAVAADRYAITGDLTIKGNTRPVTLAVVNYGELSDPTMGHRIGYGAETRIQRKDFGLNIDTVMDGRMVLGNEIQITIEGELVETADEPAGAMR